MTLLRSAIFGGIAAIGMPAIVRTLKESGSHPLLTGTMSYHAGHGLIIHWSWPTFVIVTLFIFFLLQQTHGRN